MPEKVDVTVEDHGSIYLFHPVSEEAQDWVTFHVSLEPWQWLCNRFSVEHRYAADLVAGMLEDGLTVGNTPEARYF